MSNIVTAWPLAEGAKRVTQLFHDRFETTPDGVWQAPGRVNLIGEHVDYNGGVCLPIALPHRTFAAVKKREGGRSLRLVSNQADGLTVVDLDEVGPHDSPQKVDGWGAYVAGVLWALERKGYGPFSSYDIAIDSCVPFGAGLSSSAALECAIAVAIDEIENLGLGSRDGQPYDEGRKVLVEACITAENIIAGANTGGLDQSSSLRCRKDSAISLDCQSGDVATVPFDLSSHNMTLLVIDTKAEHSLNDGQYAARRAACEAAAKQLGVDYLANVEDPEAALQKIEDEEQKKRARHVFGEVKRTLETIELLNSGSLEGDRLQRVGELFFASHESLRTDYEVTCPELDVTVEAARKAGAYGARMTGGGFGGSAIAIVDNAAVEATMQAIEKAYADNDFGAPEFLLVTPASPAGRVDT